MKQQTLKNIDSYIANVIKESVKSALQKRSLLEQEKSEEKQDNSGEAPFEEKEKLKKGEITVDDIVEKLNSIRAGKSFKDEEISASLEKYFNDLEEEEKVALFAFLKGISQIVTGEFEPDVAFEPSDAPAKIEMKKKGGPAKRTIKPLVIKAPQKEAEKKEKAKSSEDTSGPVPITPKKK
jgi:hypothetical protein